MGLVRRRRNVVRVREVRRAMRRGRGRRESCVGFVLAQ